MSENVISRREKLDKFVFDKAQTNAGLWLNKFISEQKVENGKESSAKSKLVEDVSKIEVSAIYERFFNDIWKPSLDKYNPKSIEISGRMIVGLGSEGVLETSITLHRTYGVPYIPGSALKGLAASFAHRFMGEDWKKETPDKITKQKNPIGKAHELMFGSQDSAGYVIFHDALYIPNSYGNKPLRPDILTVHHQKYYEGKGQAPADWDSPVPIPLLSAQGHYLLAVSANSGDEDFDKKLTDLAVEILDLALRQEGVGAKTSSGYGRALIKDYAEIQISGSPNTAELRETSSPVSQPLSETEAEKLARLEQRNLNIFANIEKKLQEISNYEKESRNKFRTIVKDDLSRMDGELKKKAATKIVEKVREVSQQDDAMLEGAAWFITAKDNQ